MSVEAFGPDPNRYTSDERAHGIRTASGAINRIRELIGEHHRLLNLEKEAEVVDLAIIKHLTEAIEELEGELEDALAFLEEFDPILFQKMKDNS